MADLKYTDRGDVLLISPGCLSKYRVHLLKTFVILGSKILILMEISNKAVDNYNSNAFGKQQEVTQRGTYNYLVDEERMIPSPGLCKMAQRRVEP